MRIINLKASNWMILKVIDVTPGSGPVVTITGKNGQGKTSLLDAIYFGLTGEKPAHPIRLGEEKAIVKIALGSGTLPELTVTRIVSRGVDGKLKPTLKVEGDGVTYKKPQDVLDGLLGALSFDPLEFVRLAPKVQRDKLLALVGLNFDDQDRRRKDLFDERTAVNRQVRDLEGELAKFGDVDAIMEFQKLPDRPVDVLELTRGLESVNKVIAHGEGIELRIETDTATLENLKEQVLSLEVSLFQSKSELHNLNIPARQNERSIIQNKIASAATTNQQIAQRDQHEALSRRHTAIKLSALKLTDQIEELDQAKAGAIGAAQMPIDGLSFDDNGLLFNGVPLSQVASSQQIKVTLAMGMAMNPTLRVLRIKDGSLLDDDSMKIIEQMATAHDFQVLIETVLKGEPTGIVIEQGEVVNGNPQG